MQHPILMGADHPNGEKLEDLLIQLQGEILAKTKKIEKDSSQAADLVRRNNITIITLLREAEQLQRTSMMALESIAPNKGPVGKPRIGNRIYHIGD